MPTDLKQQEWLDRLQSGYRATLRLKQTYRTSESIKKYVDEQCRQLRVRYHETIRENALDAALSYVGKAAKPVTPAEFDHRFRDFFHEQLLVFVYRKLPATDRNQTHGSLGQLLRDNGQTIRRTLMNEFTHLDTPDIDDVVGKATEIFLQQIGNQKFRLTSSIYTYLHSTARHLAHQRLAERLQQKSLPLPEESPGDLERQHERLRQRVVAAADQYMQQHGTAQCQAFLEVYWQLKSPFDFTDPLTGTTVRETVVQERLGLSDAQMAGFRSRTIRLSQTETMQLISGRTRRTQKVQDYYQTCVAGLLQYVCRVATVPLLMATGAVDSDADKTRRNAFKKLVVRWLKTMRTPTITFS